MNPIKYSQNYLKSNSLVRKLVEKAHINDKDYVIEIGAGKGRITDVLAHYAWKVTAIEYDVKLYEKLVNEHSRDNVEYVHADFLNYALPKYGSYKIFSNIPFQITADIIRKLTEAENPPEEIFLIVQKEAAKKYCGIPFQKYEGLRAAILKAQYEMHILHRFQKTDFTPVPNVEIVLLHCKKKNQNMTLKEYSEYKDFVSFFYQIHKGETAGERLSLIFSNKQITRLAKEHHFDAQKSYTMITASQWNALYRYAYPLLCMEQRERIKGSYRRLLKQQNKLRKQHRTHSRY